MTKLCIKPTTLLFLHPLVFGQEFDDQRFDHDHKDSEDEDDSREEYNEYDYSDEIPEVVEAVNYDYNDEYEDSGQDSGIALGIFVYFYFWS